VIIEFSDNFLKEAKKLSKKFRLFKTDLQEVVQEIEEKKDLGTDLGNNLYKKRLKNFSIPTGKSGGFRVIIYKKIEDTIVLISIYSKTQKDNLSDEELDLVLNNIWIQNKNGKKRKRKETKRVSK
jgi:hypothetical protein